MAGSTLVIGSALVVLALAVGAAGLPGRWGRLLGGAIAVLLFGLVAPRGRES